MLDIIRPTFRSHAQSANSYLRNFPISCPGLIFGLLLLPCVREIRIWVYQLWRIDFLWICGFSIIFYGFWRFLDFWGFVDSFFGFVGPYPGHTSTNSDAHTGVPPLPSAPPPSPHQRRHHYHRHRSHRHNHRHHRTLVCASAFVLFGSMS